MMQNDTKVIRQYISIFYVPSLDLNSENTVKPFVDIEKLVIHKLYEKSLKPRYISI